jgi:hypothetical protein
MIKNLLFTILVFIGLSCFIFLIAFIGFWAFLLVVAILIAAVLWNFVIKPISNVFINLFK